jgi:crotonobetainyl-CoA:carnitine CoA-transferase CaiB-like acyl-CoA transferase
MTRLPLHGIVVADYSQYVAGPLCTLLLADLGADVIKVEPPQGDQWRRQEPCGHDLSGPFVALNRNKRSIVLDLKSVEGRERSASLVADADIVVHNYPAHRAAAFGLGREAVRAANPGATLVVISAFGSDGPAAERTAYDLSAQAASGLLMADARAGDRVPIRAGGVAMADLAAGFLAAVAALAGLARARATGRGGELEVSLLGAALAVQIQRFVSIEAHDGRQRATQAVADIAALDRVARQAELGLRINPYYRAYAASDGFLTIACLNMAQRESLLEAFGLEDPSAGNPDELPASPQEVRRREQVVEALASALAERPARESVALLRTRGVPCEEVRTLESLFDEPQVEANGLVQQILQPGLGPVRLLGNVFKLDGGVFPSRRPGPARGEHTEEVMSPLLDLPHASAARR